MTAALPAELLPPDLRGAELAFAEPWQAQAFAMTLQLHERGVFTWPQWAAALAAQITQAQRAGDPDRGDTYWQHWLAALEAVVAERLPAAAPGGGADELQHWRDAWARCAERTPHGQPLQLRPEDFHVGLA
ncbi:MAG: nitrile hydratase accessory protein [Rubrivivax sp.]|nr:nitrile hydratase accessory protein [Rubrivivax sp.]